MYFLQSGFLLSGCWEGWRGQPPWMTCLKNNLLAGPWFSILIYMYFQLTLSWLNWRKISERKEEELFSSLLSETNKSKVERKRSVDSSLNSPTLSPDMKLYFKEKIDWIGNTSRSPVRSRSNLKINSRKAGYSHLECCSNIPSSLSGALHWDLRSQQVGTSRATSRCAGVTTSWETSWRWVFLLPDHPVTHSEV